MSLDRRSFVRATSGAALAAVAGTTARSAAQGLETVRVLTFPSDASKQFLYPIKAGIFRKLGLDVELTGMSSGEAIIAAVVGGSAEFGGASLFSVFNAYGRGIPIRIAAPAAIYDTNNCDAWLVVNKDAPIQAPRDLSGKIMGSDSPTDLYTVATRVWVTQNGGDGTSIRSIGLGASEQLFALQQGRIDFAVFKPPYLTIAMGSGRVRVLGKPMDVIAPRFLLSCSIATTDYLTREAQTAKTFIQGLTEGAHYVNRHQAETVDMVAEFTKQDPNQLRAGVREVIGEHVTLADIQKPLDFAFKYGVIDRQYDARALLSSVMPMQTG